MLSQFKGDPNVEMLVGEAAVRLPSALVQDGPCTSSQISL